MCTKPSPRPRRSRGGVGRRKSPYLPVAPSNSDVYLQNVTTAATVGFERLHHDIQSLLTIYHAEHLRGAIPPALLATMPRLQELHAAISAAA